MSTGRHMSMKVVHFCECWRLFIGIFDRRNQENHGNLKQGFYTCIGRKLRPQAAATGWHNEVRWRPWVQCGRTGDKSLTSTCQLEWALNNKALSSPTGLAFMDVAKNLTFLARDGIVEPFPKPRICRQRGIQAVGGAGLGTHISSHVAVRPQQRDYIHCSRSRSTKGSTVHVPELLSVASCWLLQSKPRAKCDVPSACHAFLLVKTVCVGKSCQAKHQT